MPLNKAMKLAGHSAGRFGSLLAASVVAWSLPVSGRQLIADPLGGVPWVETTKVTKLQSARLSCDVTSTIEW